MKFSIAIVISLLFASSLLFGQLTSPTSLSFEAVPTNTSPAQEVALVNNGSTTLTVSVSSSSPFAISENRCANGVKPNTHCNVYVTYSPSVVGEVDNGTLTFNYGEGVVTAPLSGKGVSSIPITSTLGNSKLDGYTFKLGETVDLFGRVGVTDTHWLYAPPTGENVSFSCTNGQENVNYGTAELQLCAPHESCSGHGNLPYDYVYMDIVPNEVGSWTCTMTYAGDGLLGESSAQNGFNVKATKN